MLHGVDGHLPVMLAATALDVRYRLLLNAIQLESAKKMLMEQVSASWVCNFLSVTSIITMFTTGMIGTPVIHICVQSMQLVFLLTDVSLLIIAC